MPILSCCLRSQGVYKVFVLALLTDEGLWSEKRCVLFIVPTCFSSFWKFFKACSTAVYRRSCHWVWMLVTRMWIGNGSLTNRNWFYVSGYMQIFWPSFICTLQELDVFLCHSKGKIVEALFYWHIKEVFHLPFFFKYICIIYSVIIGDEIKYMWQWLCVKLLFHFCVVL